jgi:anti-anti-sigma regulatory factor
LEVRIKTEGGTTYAYLKGEADVFGWESLTTMADTLMNEIPTPQRVVFDLEELDFACARTIRILADICDRLDADGVLTSVRGMRPVVARVAGLVDVRLPAAYV